MCVNWEFSDVEIRRVSCWLVGIGDISMWNTGHVGFQHWKVTLLDSYTVGRLGFENIGI